MNGSKITHDGIDGNMWTGSFYVEQGEEDGCMYYLNAPYFLAATKTVGLESGLIGSVHLGMPIRPVYDKKLTESGADTLHEGNKDKEPEAVYTINGHRVSLSLDTLSPGIYIIRYTDGTTAKISL